MTFEVIPETMRPQTLLIRLEFLGFRYHGWQIQPTFRTLEGMLKKTLKFVLPDHRVKVLGAGRTDAMVSATDFAVQCIVEPRSPLALEELASTLNENLPPDMRIARLEEAPDGFNALSDVVKKQYSYYFCYGAKPHPFAAPLLGYFKGALDLEAMQEAALLFKGTYDFSAFIAGGSEASVKKRTVLESRIRENRELTASFFPESTYEYVVEGKGFGRYQVRLMMAALVAIGRGQADVSALKQCLESGTDWPVGTIAPASGLQVKSIDYGRLNS